VNCQPAPLRHAEACIMLMQAGEPLCLRRAFLLTRIVPHVFLNLHVRGSFSLSLPNLKFPPRTLDRIQPPTCGNGPHGRQCRGSSFALHCASVDKAGDNCGSEGCLQTTSRALSASLGPSSRREDSHAALALHARAGLPYMLSCAFVQAAPSRGGTRNTTLRELRE